MTLSVIAGFSLTAIIAGFLGKARPTLLLLISVVAIYMLQPSGLEVALPTATLALMVGVWWLVSPTPTLRDYTLIALFGGIALLVALLRTAEVSPLALSAVALTVGAVATGSIIPADDTRIRRDLALGLIIVMIGLLVIVKWELLRTTLAIPLDWQWFGFSYIAFRLMHTLIDYRNGRLPAISLRDFSLYVIFFPALAAGPIDRVDHFVGQLNRPLDRDRLLTGAVRIGMGLFKKFVLADTLAYIALSSQLVRQTHQTWSIWIMLYAYAFQIYFDFSGYTDIAIGIGQLAGITLPENFSAPYLKRNLTAFWNSWHITLSTWFRNYFFTPLSRALMSRSPRSRRLLIMLIAQVSTMILIGLWHGVAINFVLWGAWHGVGLWAHRWISDHSSGWDGYVQARPRLSIFMRGFSVIFTFHYVALGWIFFALPDLNLIGKALLGLLGIHG